MNLQDLKLRSYHPKVSMDPKVHYVTQSSVYDQLAVFDEKSTGRSRTPKHDHKEARRENRSERRLGKQIAYNLLCELELPTG